MHYLLKCVLFITLFRSSLADSIDVKMEAALKKWKIRGVSIVFFDKSISNTPIFRSYGRSGSSNVSAKITKDTAFTVASVSKIFAGAAVSALIADGFITGLDDDICDVIPETWKLSTCRNPNYPNIPITWRMLVTHRSSLVESISGTYDDDDDFVLPSYGPNNAYQGFAFGNPTCPLEDVTGFYRDYLSDVVSSTSVGSKALFDGLPIDWYEVQKSEGGAWAKRKPGARRQYSNLAVGYIAALVELATGESFEDFSQRRIFKPLGMSSTSWFRSSLPTDTPLATPIYYDGRRFIDEKHYCFIDYASGQLYSTTVDLSIFLDSMLRYGSPTLWDESIGRASLLCQEKDASGKKVSNKNCEFGVNWGILGNWMKDLGSWTTPLNRYDWTDGGNHEGLDLGAHSQVVLLPKDGVYLAALVNTGEWKNNGAHILIREFVNAIHADPPV